MPGENRFTKYTGQQGGGMVVRDPYREAEEARKAQDQELERQRVAIAQQGANITAQNAGVTAQNAQLAREKAERERLEWEATHFPDGTPKPKAAASTQANPDRIPQILTVLDNLKQIREKADDFLAVGRASRYVSGDGILPTLFGQNRSDIEGALQMVQGDLIQQQIALLSQMNGEKGVASIANSETEAARMAASIANLSPDQEIGEFQVGLDRAEQYYLRQLARLEGADTNDPEVRKFYDIREPGQEPAPPNALTRLRIGNAAAPASAPFGATEGQSVVVPPEMNAEHDALVARLMNEGGGRVDPELYAQEMSRIAAKYPDFAVPPESSAQWARDMNAYLDAGGKTIPGGVQIQDRPLSDVEWLRNSLVNNPVGSTAAGALNAGGFGLPSLLAGDEYATLQNERPMSQFVGEVGGGITGTALLGRGLGMGASRVANEGIASLLANPLAADVAYGGIYGATQADDPLTGLVTGGVASFAGNRAGRWLGNNAPRLTGVRMPEDALLPGERAVFDAASNTGVDEVADALTQGQSLGVPVSLADASPDVNSLTGAALRRSPEAMGNARPALTQRSRGQYDRLLEAVERDLGPVENIPQRSEDLITQARAAAGPLYDSAYAAPGAGAISEDLAPLLQRPSMARALGNARRIAAEEGTDPSTLGFDINEAGEVVLNRVPSFRTLDYVKRGLDDVLEGYRDKTTGRLTLDTEGRAVNDTLREFLSVVDAANPDYAAARAAYAGPAAERDAMRRGQDALRMSPNQLGVNVGNASPAQLDQMRLGFQSSLAEQAGRLRNNTNPFNILDNPQMEQRLGAMQYGGDEIARLLSQRDLEAQVAGSTNRLIGNSATAERGLADELFGAQSGMMNDLGPMALETAISGAPWATGARSIASRLGGQALRDWRTLGVGRRATDLANEIAPIALDMNPAAAEEALFSMVERDAVYQAIVEELLAGARNRGGHFGASVGGAAALPVTR
jgi:hypothetical protein